MAKAAGWIVAALVGLVALLIDSLRRARQDAKRPPDATKVQVEIDTITQEAQNGLDALWDDYQGDDATAAIAAAADAARGDR